MKTTHDFLARDSGSREGRIADAVNEFRERCARGKQPDFEEFAARFPEVAPELHRLLPALAALDAGGRGGAEAPTALGDFRIRREIGRGGMAVVYEAEQRSLGRRVALKVLPFASVMDPRQLQRFRNEAQAAAHLHHGHIVPVHATGCERGVHYYAMQYIEGMSLAQVVEELRAAAGQDVQPDSSPAALEAITKGKSTKSGAYCRSVARLGIQAAEALDHAHRQGVVHRDIKPANLLVDASGHLWITDFGLASFTSQPGLTMTGDLVGTVRYMSPEQARAKQLPVDHRTDIYSLGVTLYELLTLEPAFPGDDPHRVIQDIALREPLSTRRLNEAVPNELETILLKAMAKDPGERFATAQEFADDLDRFLEHKPINARRPTLVQRVGKWARRHAALVGGGIAVLVLAVAGLFAGATLLWREQGRTAEAYEELSREQARTEQAYEAEAAQRERAEANLRLVLAALDEVYLDQAEITPKLRAGLSRDLLEKALGFYERFAAANRDHAEGRLHAGQSLMRAGWIHRALGSEGEATKAFEAAGAVNREVLRDHPDHPAAHGNLGNCFLALDRVDEAIEEYQKAIALDPELAPARYGLANALGQKGDREGQIAAYREAIALRPDYAEARVNLGKVFLQQRALDDALREFEEAVRLKPDLAPARVNVGIVRAMRGDMDGAIDAFREAARRTPDHAKAHAMLAQALAEQDKYDEALDASRRACQLEPWNEDLRHRLSLACYNLGNTRLAQKDDRAAIDLYRESVELEPGYAPAHSNLGVAYWNEKRIEDAAGAWGRAVELDPGDALAHQNLGLALLDLKRLDEAIVQLQEAVRMQSDLPQAQYNLAKALVGKERYAEGIAVYRKAVELRHPWAPRELARLLVTCPDRSLWNTVEALALAKQAVERTPYEAAARNALCIAYYRAGNWAECIDALGTSRGAAEHIVVAMARWQLGQKDQARALYREMRAWIKENAPDDPDLKRFAAEAAELMGAEKD